jgi:hypothetical protein
VGPQYKHMDLSDTAKRVIWLAERLPNLWTRIYMDNLFNSEKLFSALMLAKCWHTAWRVRLSVVSRMESSRLSN